MAIGRTDTMQELITILESYFEETIIGSDVNIVKHLFYYLKADNREFEFIYEEEPLIAAVEDIQTSTVMLTIPDFVEKGSRRARVRDSFGHLTTFIWDSYIKGGISFWG